MFSNVSFKIEKNAPIISEIKIGSLLTFPRSTGAAGLEAAVEFNFSSPPLSIYVVIIK
jgi:hypothetical protein